MVSEPDVFAKGPMQYGQVNVFAVFRCRCGQTAAMGDQPNGSAGMLHGTPHCEPFEAVRSMSEAVAYYGSLDPLPLCRESLAELLRNQRYA